MSEDKAFMTSTFFILIALIIIGLIAYCVSQIQKDKQKQIINEEKEKNSTELDLLLYKLEKENKK